MGSIAHERCGLKVWPNAGRINMSDEFAGNVEPKISKMGWGGVRQTAVAGGQVRAARKARPTRSPPRSRNWPRNRALRRFWSLPGLPTNAESEAARVPLAQVMCLIAVRNPAQQAGLNTRLAKSTSLSST